MKSYLVGGAVRDRLLGLPIRDRDWVVVGATEAQMLELGFRRAAQEFPVYLHPQTGEQYALARREIKTGPGYKGFSVDAGTHVTLEEDLVRRDLTINALAEDDSGQLIDLFDGRGDLDNGILRHISPAFTEDPVRLLRVARFAARLGRWGFRVAHGTHGLMKRMASSPDLKALKPERVWREMKQALAEDQPWRFYQVLHRCGALAQLIPELEHAMASSTGHGEKGQAEEMPALTRAVRLGADPKVRFAVAMYAAARLSPDAKGLSLRLRAEREFSELLEMLLRLGDDYRLAVRGKTEQLFRLIEAARAPKQPERFRDFLAACSALWPAAAGEDAENIRQALTAVEKVRADSLQAEGFQGLELGRELRRRRLSAIRQSLANR